MKKIILSIFTIILILGTLATLVFADTDVAKEKADELYNMGLFKGTDIGYELDRKPTRAEALVMLIRLLGKENDALNSVYVHPFTDVPQWANKYVAYGYAKGLTNGISKTEFAPNSEANSNMYLTFVLRALGYSDSSGDFSWDKPNSLASSVGIVDSNINLSKFYRRDAVLVSHKALYCKLKGKTQTLYNKLESEGALSINTYVTISVTDNSNKKLSADSIYTYDAGTSLKISVSSTKSNLSGFEYYWNSNGSFTKEFISSSSKTVVVPSNLKYGEKDILYVRAKDTSGIYTSWRLYSINVTGDNTTDEETGITITLKQGSTTLSTSKTYTYDIDTALKITATPSSDVERIEYYWSNQSSSNRTKVSGYTKTIYIPDSLTEGKTYKLYIRALSEDSEYTDWISYSIKIGENSTVDDETGITITLKQGSTTLSTSKTYTYDIDTALKITATPSSDVERIEYYWSNQSSSNRTKVSGYTKTIYIPDDLTEGKTYKLYIRALSEDSEYTDWVSYSIKINNSSTSDDDTGLSIVVKNGSNSISTTKDNKYPVNTSLKITVSPSSKVEKLEYYWNTDGKSKKKTVSSYYTNITIPESFEEDEEYTLYVRALNEDGDYTQWYEYDFIITDEEVTGDGIVDISVSVKYDATTLSTSKTYELQMEKELKIIGSSSTKTDSLEYYWSSDGSNSKVTYNGYTTTIKIPNNLTVGETYILYVRGKDINGDYTTWLKYNFKILDDTEVKISVKHDTDLLDINNTFECEAEESLTIKATPLDSVSEIQYAWDTTKVTSLKTVSSYKTTIDIPSTFTGNTTHTLYIRVYDINNKKYVESQYKFKIIVNPTEIELDKKELELNVGDADKLTATTYPTTATEKDVIWSTNNSSVVTVDQNGNVSAISAGTATIIATTKNGISSTCSVTVTEAEPVVE